MIHPHGYWLEINETNTHVCDNPLCEAIIKMFKVKTAVDIGCGDGAYTQNFIDSGINCCGFDGNPLTYKLTSGLCNVMDFSQPVIIGKFDLVLCLEVGEHVPKEYEQTFINNICKASKKWICMSWGVPGQPGYGHVNNQSNDYIRCEIKRRGFNYRDDLSNKLRKKSTFEWFANTLMVYELGK
jgi:hypothetical protein